MSKTEIPHTKCPNGCVDSHKKPRIIPRGSDCCFRCQEKDPRFAELDMLIKRKWKATPAEKNKLLVRRVVAA